MFIGKDAARSVNQILRLMSVGKLTYPINNSYKSSISFFLHSCHNTHSMTMLLRVLISCLIAVHPIIATFGIFYQEISEPGGNTVTEESTQKTSIIHESIHECSMKENCKYVIKNISTGKFTLYNNEHDLPSTRTGLRIWKKTHHGMRLLSC